MSSIQTMWSVFRIRLKNMLAYRTAAWAGVATQFAFGGMYILLYIAFYTGASGDLPMSMSEVTTYMWLQQAFLMLFVMWNRDWEIGAMITEGHIAYELCRPIELYWLWYFRLLAQRTAAAFLRFWPILLFAFLIPQPYGMMLPPSIASFALFLVTMVTGTLLMVAMSMLIYASIFKTMSLIGSFGIFATLCDLLSGTMIPVPLMPQWLQTVLNYLPFRYTLDFSARVYTGNIAPQDVWWQLLVQLGWLAILIVLGRLLYKKELKHVVVQGG